MIAGFVDPSFSINCLRGSDVWYLNQGFGKDGSANDDGHPTLLPSSSKWEFKVTYFYNLAQKGVKLARIEGHDPAAWKQIMFSGWEAVASDALETLDAARLFGIKVIITLGGLSDKITWQQAEKLLDETSSEFLAFKVLMAKVADALYGHPALKLLEGLNEADFMSVIIGHWLPKYRAAMLGDAAKGIKPDPYALIKGYARWQTALLDGVRALQKRPGTPLGMGTAMDGTLFCDPNGNAAMPWGTSACINEIIPMMAAGCDIWTPHVYQMADDADHLLVFRRDKLPSFVQAAKAANKELIIAEAGGLWRGGIWTAQLQAVYDQYPELMVCWMIRSWDPKVWTRPSIPARVPYSPAPVETPETPAPVADPVPEPSDPSSPAQEPPDEPEEPTEPQEPPGEEPEDQEPIEDLPVEEEPPIEPPSPPAANEPEGKDPSSDERPPSEPSPETGRGLVFVQVLQLVFEIVIKMFKRKR